MGTIIFGRGMGIGFDVGMMLGSASRMIYLHCRSSHSVRVVYVCDSIGVLNISRRQHSDSYHRFDAFVIVAAI